MSDSNSPIDEKREDLLRSAVSFLSSPNVQSADKEKKVAFLQKKGLTEVEIDEAFERVKDTHPLPANASTSRPPSVPPRMNATIYEPLPPSMPIEKVFALAIVLGMGTVGLASAIVGALKRFMSPVFNRITEYKHNRYIQHRQVADKILNSLSRHHKENDDLDAVIDQGEEDSLMEAVVKHQGQMNTQLEKIAQRVKDQMIGRKGFNANLSKPFLSSIETFNTSYSSLPGLKSDIRTLKAVLLNRRNFP